MASPRKGDLGLPWERRTTVGLGMESGRLDERGVADFFYPQRWPEILTP